MLKEEDFPKMSDRIRRLYVHFLDPLHTKDVCTPTLWGCTYCILCAYPSLYPAHAKLVWPVCVRWCWGLMVRVLDIIASSSTCLKDVVHCPLALWTVAHCLPEGEDVEMWECRYPYLGCGTLQEMISVFSYHLLWINCVDGSMIIVLLKSWNSWGRLRILVFGAGIPKP